MRALSVTVLSLLAAGAPPLGAQSMSPAATQGAATPKDMARALRVLRASPVMDGHNDLPWRIREDSVHPGDVEAYDLRRRAPGMTDLARLKQGHVGAQFWSVYLPGEAGDATYAAKGKVASTPGYARVQLEQIDIARRVIAKYPETFTWAPTAAAVRTAFSPTPSIAVEEVAADRDETTGTTTPAGPATPIRTAPTAVCSSRSRQHSCSSTTEPPPCASTEVPNSRRPRTRRSI